ncbi:MAG: hypothetical protein R3311_12205, partial [Oceanisphaera sp.]|nr:hypothetical protein [Oceanisphaera sp.]
WGNRLFGEQAMRDMGRFVELLRNTQMPKNAWVASGPEIRKQAQSMWGRMAKLAARLKMPMVSQWVDNAVDANVSANMTRAGETAVAVPAPVFMPSANLSQAVSGAGFGAAAPVAQGR